MRWRLVRPQDVETTLVELFTVPGGSLTYEPVPDHYPAGGVQWHAIVVDEGRPPVAFPIFEFGEIYNSQVLSNDDATEFDVRFNVPSSEEMVFGWLS